MQETKKIIYTLPSTQVTIIMEKQYPTMKDPLPRFYLDMCKADDSNKYMIKYSNHFCDQDYGKVWKCLQDMINKERRGLVVSSWDEMELLSELAKLMMECEFNDK